MFKFFLHIKKNKHSKKTVFHLVLYIKNKINFLVEGRRGEREGTNLNFFLLTKNICL